jgi:hypothetical protein
MTREEALALGRVSGQIKWTEMVSLNGTEEKQKEARGGPLVKKQAQVTCPS